MKNLLIIFLLTFGIVFGASADNGAKASVEERATHLTNQMIRSLRLNNYQANEVRAINIDKAAKITAIETAHAGNQELIDQLCKNVCAERDRELEHVLSTVQYNNYYGSRKALNKSDKEFMAKASRPDNADQMAASSIAGDAVGGLN